CFSQRERSLPCAVPLTFLSLLGEDALLSIARPYVLPFPACQLLSTVCRSAKSGSNIEICVEVASRHPRAGPPTDAASVCRFRIIHTPAPESVCAPETAAGAQIKEIPNANVTARLVKSVRGTLLAREEHGCYVFEADVPIERTSSEGGAPEHLSNGAERREKQAPKLSLGRVPSYSSLRDFSQELRGKKIVVYAQLLSLCGKNLTRMLAEFGADVAHIPVDEPPAGGLPKVGGSSPPANAAASKSPAAADAPPVLADRLRPADDGPTPFCRTDSSYIIIDDDIPTLKEQMNTLREMYIHARAPPTPYSPHNPNSQDTVDSSVGSWHKRRRSNPSLQVAASLPAIVYLTSIQNYHSAREAIHAFVRRSISALPYGQHLQTQHAPQPPYYSANAGAAQPHHGPRPGSHIQPEHLSSFIVSRVLVVLQPSGPRRLLTALYTAARLPTAPRHSPATGLSPPPATAGYEFRSSLESEVNPMDLLKPMGHGGGPAVPCDHVSPAFQTSSAIAAPMPTATSPGGTAILFEPIPGASLSNIRNGTKTMRARLVTPVGTCGRRGDLNFAPSGGAALSKERTDVASGPACALPVGDVAGKPAVAADTPNGSLCAPHGVGAASAAAAPIAGAVTPAPVVPPLHLEIPRPPGALRNPGAMDHALSTSPVGAPLTDLFVDGRAGAVCSALEKGIGPVSGAAVESAPATTVTRGT
ncbi:MAG: hypothetical protein BJ554DRAFT_8040, partial [Olpidium bornovanus]